MHFNLHLPFPHMCVASALGVGEVSSCETGLIHVLLFFPIAFITHSLVLYWLDDGVVWMGGGGGFHWRSRD